MRHRLLHSAFIAIAMLLVGCRLVELPPGFARVGEVLQNDTSDAASPEAVYSLMSWYSDANRDKEVPRLWNDYVQKRTDDARTALLMKWRKGLVENANGMLKEHPDDFLALVPRTILMREDWERIETELHSLKVRLAAPVKVDVPMKECLDDVFWRGRSQQAKESFTEWGQQRSLTIPPPESYKASEIVVQLSTLHEALKLKKAIHEALSDSQGLSAQKQFTVALDLLMKTNEALQDNPNAAPLAELKKEYEDKTALYRDECSLGVW